MQFMQPMQPKKAARVAGFLYLLLVLVAPWRLMIIPNKLFVRGDAPATVANIAANEWLFRSGIITDLLSGTLIIFITLAFYRLFKAVDQNLAALVVILGSLMVAPIYFINTINDGAALLLARGDADFLSAFDQPQREALAMLFLRLHFYAILSNEVFWGLWLFPLAMLAWKSRSMPRFLSVWLVINGFAYLVMSFTGWLAPQYYNRVSNYAFPALLGEAVFMLWLVIMGVNEKRWTPADAGSYADGGTARAAGSYADGGTRFAPEH